MLSNGVKMNVGLRFAILCFVLALFSICQTSFAEESAPIKIEVIGETASDKDSSDVMAALHRLLTYVEHKNFEQIGNCLSEDVVMTDDKSNEPVYGKKDVMERVKSNLDGGKKKSPVKSMVLQHPFVNVKGDTAMVSFLAKKELADGSKFESLCSEVYERKNGEWLVLKFKTNWKPAK